jgi:hypothetical protein
MPLLFSHTSPDSINLWDFRAWSRHACLTGQVLQTFIALSSFCSFFRTTHVWSKKELTLGLGFNPYKHHRTAIPICHGLVLELY